MDFLANQARFNKDTRERWDHYRSHRNKVTDLIAQIGDQRGERAGSLAILGAGNGNDLEVQSLADRFDKIHLFDFDPEALSSLGRRHLNVPRIRASVVVEPPVDLSGIAGELIQIRESSITESDILTLAAKARNPQAVLPQQSFDVVVSSCMLSQLLAAVVDSLGNESPFKDFMMIAVRDGHLDLMSRLLKPGGCGLLVTDFVSSDTLPEIREADSEDSVLQLSRRAIDEKNFFTGTNPWAVKKSLSRLLVEDPLGSWTISRPWRWQIGDTRFYLVTALIFSKPDSHAKLGQS